MRFRVEKSFYCGADDLNDAAAILQQSLAVKRKIPPLVYRQTGIALKQYLIGGVEKRKLQSG